MFSLARHLRTIGIHIVHLLYIVDSFPTVLQGAQLSNALIIPWAPGCASPVNVCAVTETASGKS